MSKLFGPEAATPAGRARIKQELLATLQALLKSKNEGGADIRIENLAQPKAAAEYRPDGIIAFAPKSAGESDQDLAETMVHEHAHAGAHAKDGWYLDRGDNPFQNLQGQLYPFTFDNAVTNADTLARSVTTLANN
ncbi:MAG TPA: hypothetical protein VL997_03320 [Dyella sp.]|nr:hypothetical protein [Dyella sp.]